MAPFSKTPKRKRHYDDDEVPSSPTKGNETVLHEDYEDEEMEEVDAETIPPYVMLSLVKEFEEFVAQNHKEGVQTRFLHRIAGDFIKNREEEIELDKFLKSYRKYSTLAIKAMTLKTSTECLLEYLDRGETVKMFPDFPKQPPSLLHYYSKKNGVPIAFGQLGNAKAIMVEDQTGRLECEQELTELEERYLDDLESFAETHAKQLTETQRNFLSGKIKKYKKKLHGPIPRTPKAKKIKEKEPTTAFDYYVKSMREKYTDLDPEAREKKLRKKFNKLDESMKEIFEKIAMK